MTFDGPFPTAAELIDHRCVMALVDRIEACDDTSARCLATIRADNPFLADGKLPNWVLLEYLAQAVAMFAGYRRRQGGETHRHGLLLGCRSMTLADAPLDIGERLDLLVEEDVRLEQFGRFRGTALCRGHTVAHGVLAVLETESWPDPAARVAGAGNQPTGI